MSAYTVVTARENERFWELNNGMVRADGPAFLEHDSTVAQYWSRLDETFPDNQFCLVEQESGQAVGMGNSISVAFEANGLICRPEDSTGYWKKVFRTGLLAKQRPS